MRCRLSDGIWLATCCCGCPSSRPGNGRCAASQQSQTCTMCHGCQSNSASSIFLHHNIAAAKFLPSSQHCCCKVQQMTQKPEQMPPKMLPRAQEMQVTDTHLADPLARAGCWLHLRFCLRCGAACPADDLEVPLNRTCTMQGFMAAHRHPGQIQRQKQKRICCRGVALRVKVMQREQRSIFCAAFW